MANPVLGLCVCPVCECHGAEVREGSKGAPYIVCDNCVSQVRTMSRAGRVAILERLTKPKPVHKEATAAEVANSPPAVASPTPEAAQRVPAKQRKSAWTEVFGIGGSDAA